MREQIAVQAIGSGPMPYRRDRRQPACEVRPGRHESQAGPAGRAQVIKAGLPVRKSDGTGIGGVLLQADALVDGTGIGGVLLQADALVEGTGIGGVLVQADALIEGAGVVGIEAEAVVPE